LVLVVCGWHLENPYGCHTKRESINGETVDKSVKVAFFFLVLELEPWNTNSHRLVFLSLSQRGKTQQLVQMP
jgi:hypothetical protein